ncbi:hypothetical protein [Coleofasciculus chthonoplastes]
MGTRSQTPSPSLVTLDLPRFCPIPDEALNIPQSYRGSSFSGTSQE